MPAATGAGLVYFLIVFAIGFGLGVLRVGFVIPRIGEMAATVLEVPIMLALAWPICRRITARMTVPTAIVPRLMMGAVAFGLLMLAELALSVTLGGLTPAQHWGLYQRPAAQIGLLAQLLYAAFPLLLRGGGAERRQ